MDNIFSKDTWKNAFSRDNLGSMSTAFIGPAAGIVGNIIGGGYTTGLGQGMQTVGSALGAIPGIGTALSAGLNIGGSVVNGLFGTKVDQAKLNAANAGINRLNSFVSDAQTFDDIQMPQTMANVGNVYSGGVFAKGSARRKNAALQAQANEAMSWANRSVENNIDNLIGDQQSDLLADYFAQGGPLHTNGAVFSNGVTFINNGGLHSENPFEGVPMGISPEGTPNLVEEGEVIFNDYVFSNRIRVPKAVRNKYKLRGNKELTFADAAKKVQKESEERPNDPISKRSLDDVMNRLMGEQETIRQRREANKFKRQVQNMSPEELALMQEQLGQEGLFAYGGMKTHKFPDGGYSYKRNKLNFDNNNIDFDTLYNSNSDYMKKRQYVLDNWDSDFVQNWLKNTYIPHVEDYNKSRNYKGRFSVDKNSFEKGTFDKQWGGMHTGIDKFILPFNIEDSDLLEGKDLLANSILSRDKLDTDRMKTLMQSPVYSPEEEAINALTTTPEVIQANSDLGNSKGNSIKNRSLPTWMRYAPVVGSALGLAQGLLSKPDYSNADMILEAGRDAGTYNPIRFNPIGNYLTYNPFDRLFYANQLGAQAGATRRNILNTSGGNRGAAMAGLLAADYNAQGQLGNLFRQAEEYNLAQRQAVEGFNRDTNKFNSEGMLKADIANQEAALKSRAFRLSAIARAASMRESIDQARSAGISANFTNLFDSIGNIGWENFNTNMVNSNPAFPYYSGRRGWLGYKGGSNAYGGPLTYKKKRRK